MPRLNILMVPPNDLLRHPIPNRLYHIGKRLAERHNIYLLSYPAHPLAYSKKLRDMKCIEIVFNPVVKTKNLGLYYLVNAPSMKETLARLFTREHVDVVLHANIVPSYIVTKLAYKYNVPLIYDYLDHFPESASAYYNNNFLRKLCYGIVYRIVKDVLDLSTHIVTVCYALRNLIIRVVRDSNKISLIPNGVDAALFRPIPVSLARREAALDAYDYVLLYYGSIDAWLNFEELLKALHRIRRTIDKIALVFVGLSHNEKILRELNRLIMRYDLYKNVVFVPPQPYERMPLYINAADIVVAPYRKILKNFVTPLKLLESLACAKPVITSDIIEFKLWFRRMPIVYYKHYQELEGLILKVLKSYDDIKNDLIKASEEIRAKFSWDILSRKYERILEALL